MTDLIEDRAEQIWAARPDDVEFDQYHRVGDLYYRPMEFTLRGGVSPCWQFRPVEPLVVDGIEYRAEDRHCERPMIQLFDDIYDAAGAVMFYSKPPTETELDNWVHGYSLNPVEF